MSFGDIGVNVRLREQDPIDITLEGVVGMLLSVHWAFTVANIVYVCVWVTLTLVLKLRMVAGVYTKGDVL